MSDDRPKHVPSDIIAVFEEVRDTHHPTLQSCEIPFRFAARKQSVPVKLERCSPAVRDETGVDGILLMCPEWFKANNPSQASTEDPQGKARRRAMERAIDAALCSVCRNEDTEGLKLQHPEMVAYKAVVMRYGTQPGTEADEVAQIIVARHAQGLAPGEPLPEKFAPKPQEALPETAE